MYLALAPFGGNLEGVRAASIAYFGKEPKRLSTRRSRRCWWRCRSRRNAAASIAIRNARAPARDRVLDRMVEDGAVSQTTRLQARRGAVPRLRKPMPILAPHSADQAIATVEGRTLVIALTLDSSLQKVLGGAGARPRAWRMGPDISVAIIAVDNESGDVLARVGSPDYFDERRAGQVDMTARGALARIDAEAVHLWARLRGRLCASRKPDRRSADPLRLLCAGKFRHDVSGHGAGAQGAATVAQRAGDRAARPRRLEPAVVAAEAGRRQSGAAEGRSAGPCAWASAASASRLQDLAQLYAGLARLGSTSAAARDRDAGSDDARAAAADGSGRGLAGRQCADRHAAAGERARTTGSPSRPAPATATATPGRSASTASITIGVWVGRPDGAPVPGLIGRTAAAPILFDAFARTGKTAGARCRRPPKGTLVASNAKLPLPLRRFRPVGELVRPAAIRRRSIQFPLNGSRIDVDRSR